MERVGDEVRAGLGQEGVRPPHVAELFGLWGVTIEAQAGWTRQLIDALREGRYTMADDAADAFGLPPVGR